MCHVNAYHDNDVDRVDLQESDERYCFNLFSSLVLIIFFLAEVILNINVML